MGGSVARQRRFRWSIRLYFLNDPNTVTTVFLNGFLLIEYLYGKYKSHNSNGGARLKIIITVFDFSNCFCVTNYKTYRPVKAAVVKGKITEPIEWVL